MALNSKEFEELLNLHGLVWQVSSIADREKMLKRTVLDVPQQRAILQENWWDLNRWTQTQLIRGIFWFIQTREWET